MAGSYVNPGWTDQTSPPIDENNLNALSGAVVQNQSDIQRLETLLVNYTTVENNAGQVPALKTKVLSAKNLTVAASAWTADSTYTASGYGYKATVAVTGVTSSYIPFVNFSMADAVSQNFAPVAACTANGVTIWAKTVPAGTVAIGSIVCVAAT